MKTKYKLGLVLISSFLISSTTQARKLQKASYSHALIKYTLYDSTDSKPPFPGQSKYECGKCVQGTGRDVKNTGEYSKIAKILLKEGSYNYRLEYTHADSSMIPWSICIIDSSQNGQALLYFEDVAGNDTTIKYTYSAFTVFPDQLTLDFEVVNVKSNKVITIKFENVSTQQIQFISKIGFSSSNGGLYSKYGFGLINDVILIPDTILPLEIRSHKIHFNHPNEGEFRDTLLFEVNSCNTLKLPLHAVAVLPSGIDVNSTESCTISPNPATGFATITLPAFKTRNVFLKIFDTAGNEVADFSNDLLKTELRFDTKTLPNGAYFIRLMDGKSTLSRTFMIQN